MKDELDKIWIYIGEVEMKEKENFFDYFPDGPNRKHFLYKRQYNEGFMFSIVANRDKKGAEYCNPVYIEKDYSIFTILTTIVSTQVCDFRGNPIHPFKKRKIRLVGMANWIECNEDYMYHRINEEDLEKLFESNREEIINGR